MGLVCRNTTRMPGIVVACNPGFGMWCDVRNAFTDARAAQRVNRCMAAGAAAAAGTQSFVPKNHGNTSTRQQAWRGSIPTASLTGGSAAVRMAFRILRGVALSRHVRLPADISRAHRLPLARPSIAAYQRAHFNWDGFQKHNLAARVSWLVLHAYDVLDRIPHLHHSPVDCVHRAGRALMQRPGQPVARHCVVRHDVLRMEIRINTKFQTTSVCRCYKTA